MSLQPARGKRVVLRPFTEKSATCQSASAEVVTYEYPEGFVTPVMEGRTRRWYATLTQPMLAKRHPLDAGWPQVAGEWFATKTAALTALRILNSCVV